MYTSFDLRALGILIISEAQAKDDSNLTQRRVPSFSDFRAPSSTWSVTHRVLSLVHGFRYVNKLTGVTWNDSTFFSDPRSVVPVFFYLRFYWPAVENHKATTVLQITYCTYKAVGAKILHPFDFPFDNPFFHLGLDFLCASTLKNPGTKTMRSVLRKPVNECEYIIVGSPERSHVTISSCAYFRSSFAVFSNFEVPLDD
jgi:hypothetical protein